MRRVRSCQLVLGLALVAFRAGAEPPARLRVVGDGTCPSALSVAGELPRLFPEINLTTARISPAPDDAFVEESAGGFTVTIAGQKRYFEDATNRCGERAQLAAVFIAIILDPPRFLEPTREPTPPPPPPPVRGAEPPAPLIFELGPELAAAPSAGLSSTPLAAGVGARGTWGRKIALSLGLAGVTSALHLDQAAARAFWIPIDVGARATLSSKRWDAGGELSVLLAPLHVRGQDLTPSESVWRLEAGVRAALFARIWEADRLGFFVSAYGVLFPRQYILAVAGQGEVGKTPSIWLGAQLGAVWKAN